MAWRSSSIAAAKFASVFSAFFAALGLAGCADFAGCGSASFGESASVIPEVRNNDSVSAASFFIASLFISKFDLDAGEYANHPGQKVKGASYGYVNQMLISCNK